MLQPFVSTQAINRARNVESTFRRAPLGGFLGILPALSRPLVNCSGRRFSTSLRRELWVEWDHAGPVPESRYQEYSQPSDEEHDDLTKGSVPSAG